MSYVFGIDLGTTYSCIAYIDSYGKPVVLKNSEGDSTTPSVVLFESKENVIVGSEAKRSVFVESDKTVQFIKRKIGKEKDKVTINGEVYRAPDVSAYILNKLVKDANDELLQNGVIKAGEEVKDVVITCPAYFGASEREATRAAGQLAGLNVLAIINEPTAAAISYGVTGEEKNETVLVYDLGGGTFDITVMRIDGGKVYEICSGGDDQLGGKDWDEALVNYVRKRYEDKFDEDPGEEKEDRDALYIEAENWKKSLSTREKVKMSFVGPAGRFSEELTREQHEELTRGLLDRTKILLDGVLRTAEEKGYSMDKIDKVLLVGGSSMMPQVAAMLERDYHVKASLQDPNQAVAKGAAIYAAHQKGFQDFVEEVAAESNTTVEELEQENLKSGTLDQMYRKASGGSGLAKLEISNSLSRTYGVDCDEENGHKYIVNMLMIHDPLPATYTTVFRTLHDNQSGVKFEIYESFSDQREMEIEGRVPLTTIKMEFKQQVPKHTQIETTMSLDNSGILHVVAEEKFNGSKLNTKFTLANQMEADDFREAKARLNNANIE